MFQICKSKVNKAPICRLLQISENCCYKNYSLDCILLSRWSLNHLSSWLLSCNDDLDWLSRLCFWCTGSPALGAASPNTDSNGDDDADGPEDAAEEDHSSGSCGSLSKIVPCGLALGITILTVVIIVATVSVEGINEIASYIR